MIFGGSIHPLNPQRPHISLLCLAVSVGILHGLLHAFPGYPDAIFAPTSETFGKAEDLQYAGSFHAPPLEFSTCELRAIPSWRPIASQAQLTLSLCMY